MGAGRRHTFVNVDLCDWLSSALVNRYHIDINLRGRDSRQLCTRCGTGLFLLEGGLHSGVARRSPLWNVSNVAVFRLGRRRGLGAIFSFRDNINVLRKC